MDQTAPGTTADRVAGAGSDFADLSRTIKQAGLLDRRVPGYAVRIGLTLAAFAGTWVVFGLLGDTWTRSASCTRA